MIKKIKEECYITMGQSPKGETYNSKKEGIPFLQGRRTFGRIYPTIDTWTTAPIRIAKKDSVLISVRAPVGDINIANENICIGRGLASLEMKNGNNMYLYYLLLNNMNKIKNKSIGTVFDSINTKDLENIELYFHTDEEQEKIVKILSTIDKKIELNNQISDNLKKLSQELYKRWFVDFEFPNEEGKPYKSSRGKMVDSESGKIPEGWKVSNFNDGILTKIISSGIKKYKGVKKYIATADVEGTSINNCSIITYDERPSRANMQSIKNSVWFAKMQGSIKNILVADYMNDLLNDYIFSTGFMGIECLNNSINYIWNVINDDRFVLKKDNFSTGTLMAGINNDTIKNFKYLIPSFNVLLKYEKTLIPINHYIYKLKKENENLTNLRNLLLPKLLDGIINLENVEI